MLAHPPPVRLGSVLTRDSRLGAWHSVASGESWFYGRIQLVAEYAVLFPVSEPLLFPRSLWVWVLLVFHISAHVSSCPLLKEVPSCPPCPQWTLPFSLVTMYYTYPFPNICHDLKSCCYVPGCMFVVCFHPLDVCSVRTGLGLVPQCPQCLELCLAQRRSSVST